MLANSQTQGDSQMSSERIFITGGAGFLGRALLFLEHQDRRFTIYSRDEAKHAPLKRRYPEHNFILGDVADLDRLTVAMAGHDKVIHAAAMKYVPEGERFVSEAIKVNVLGSQNVITAAIRNGISKVVGISTDKACNPQNVYGMTKRLMERLFQEADTLTPTRFVTLRYGNVVGSTGSVVPLFREQMRRQRRILLTDKAMTRFWLSVRDAVQMIDLALNDVGPMESIILVRRLPACDMLTVAQAVIEAEGWKENQIEIVETGQRGGEKIHEELVSKTEAINAETVGGYTLLNSSRATMKLTEGQLSEHYYTSATPDHRISKADFVKLIKDADSIL